MCSITKTCLYNFDPLKPHFYTVKLGFPGVYNIFLISAQNIDCGYSLEPPRRGGSNEYPQSMFWTEIWKISEFFILKFSVFWMKFSIYLNRHVFVMVFITLTSLFQMRTHKILVYSENRAIQVSTLLGGFSEFCSFQTHYENTPIQVYRKFHLQKLKIFR